MVWRSLRSPMEFKGINANADDRLAVMNYTEMEAKVCFSNGITTRHTC